MPPLTAIPTPAADAASPVGPVPTIFSGAIVAPRFAHDPDWSWLTSVAPLDRSRFELIRIANALPVLPPATGPYRAMQHARAARRLGRADVALLFSLDIACAVSRRRRGRGGPPLVYVGFTQDGPWPAEQLRRTGQALRDCDAVTVFTEAERRLYVERFGADPDRLHVVPIHYDVADAAPPGDGPPPREPPYALSLGVTNRRFTPAARACRELGIPLVVLTRPHHRHDDLDELVRLGAVVRTDADPATMAGYLRHARLAVAQFADPSLPCGFTIVMHAMRLGTPVVAGASVGMDEHVAHGESGLIAPEGDEAALRAAIARLWSDDAFAADVAEAGRRRAREHHAPTVAAPRYHRLISGLLTSQS
ncbi:MAG: glycosyltransferase [Planctomycetota bacterium]|jgi:glycosyltransferase involved in cell wall biosynthesis